MGEVLFYHLTRSALETALPQLLSRSLAKGWRVEVRSPNRDRAQWLDERLWLGDEAGFLPHGMAGGPQDGDQPILLTWGGADTKDGADRAPAGADILFALDDTAFSESEVEAHTRTCLMFNGNDETALGHARKSWKAMVDAGQTAVYWAQSETGWTQKDRREGTAGQGR